MLDFGRAFGNRYLRDGAFIPLPAFAAQFVLRW